MFEDARVSGQIRMMYAGYEQKEQNVNNNYATALGGKLKYELAELQGFNAGAAVYISHDLDFATGEGTRHNSELSSDDGSYTQLAEAYVNYKYKSFNIRAGRQILDTPLADSDDIRMISNTLEAYVLSYADGDFKGNANSLGEKAHIIEQDVSLEYNIHNELLFACVYSMQKDKENIVNTDHDWNRIQFMVNYNF